MSFYNRKVDIAIAVGRWLNKSNKTTVYFPPITVSREIGAGGGKVANIFSEKSGFLLVDKQLTEEIAKKSNYEKKHIETLNEEARSFTEEFGLALLGQKFMSETEFIRRLREEINFFANSGRVVFLGRGANIILGPEALNIRIISSIKKRIANIVKDDKFSEKKAREIVLGTDKRRTQFIKKHFSRDINDPKLYDLIINTDNLDNNSAVELITCAYCHRFSIKPPKSNTSLY